MAEVARCPLCEGHVTVEVLPELWAAIMDVIDEAAAPSPAAAVAAARRNGRIGGIARAVKLSPKRRRQIAQLGARARWGKEKP